MNAAALLEHYEGIADAPDAVGRLRRFILDLAVLGKVVPQDPRAEPASKLLSKIDDEKKDLVRRNELKKAEPCSDLTGSVDGMAEPNGWLLTNLQSVCTSITDGDHLPPPKADDGVPFLVIGNVRSQRICFEGSRYVARAYYDALDPIRRPKQGDLLYTLVGSFGIPVIVRDDREFCVQRHIGILRPSKHIDVAFLARAMESRFALDQATACATGIAQKTVPLAGLRRILMLLPPLEEQHRIVAKVGELMALCDRLEAARLQREATRDRLAAASLARLNTPDPETFQADARFAIGTALPALTTRPDQIKQLRQTILSLAVRGKLSNAGDWKARPVRLGDVASLQNGYAFKSEWFSKSGVRLLRNANVGHGRLNWAEEVRLPELQTEQFERFRLQAGDIVLSLDRPFIVTGTKVARVAASDLPALLLQRVGRFILTTSISPEYLFLWITAPEFSMQIDPGRSNGVPHISSKQVESAMLLMPPLDEQRRIVAKVDELMSICDHLEASLTRGENTRSRLLNALLHEALHPSHDNVIDMDAARRRLREKREAVASRVVERMSSSKGLGRVRVVKALYFAETHCRTALGGQWGRGDFGPYDHWILSFESNAASAGWLTRTEHSTPDGGTRIEYRPGPQLSAKARAAAQALGDQTDEFERVLALLAELDSEESEIVATLYAAWNDLLLEGKPVSDDIVITEFREHWGVPRKASFQPARLRVWLDWIRKNRLTPTGHAPSTRHQAELI